MTADARRLLSRCATGAWLSVHVFYYDAQDDLLLDCIRPLAATLRDDGVIDGFFFLRYFEEGPHVRVRTRVPDDASADAAAARIDSALHEFLTQRPSRGRLESNVDGPRNADNTFDYRLYEPEFDRYGGPAGLAVAEEHFELSSDVALDLIARTRGDRERRLTFALRALLTAGVAFGLDGDELARFMTVYARAALRGTAMSDGGVAGALEQFERGYERLAPALRALAVGLLEQSDPSDPIGRWRAGMTAAARRLRQAEAAGLLTGDRGVERFLSSYLHLLNNRLGLPYSTEAYLAFLAARLLADMEPVNA
jgi:thiopeptide-type bacteriocin biosynthesis protein